MTDPATPEPGSADGFALSALTQAELAAWLRLDLTPGIGRATARRLLAAFGSAEAIWQQPPPRWREVVTVQQASRLAQEPEGLAEQLARTALWLRTPGNTGATVLAHTLLPLGHPQYPQSLLDTEDPPLMLYVQGEARWLGSAPVWFPYPASLAIVGSRSPSPQGAQNARSLAQALAEAGLCIVSGLAQGIDAAAHAGALRAAAASPSRPATIAVVGTGLDQVYPRQHALLAAEIALHGLLVSEYPLGSPPLAQHFPQRNRIISGLAQGTLVVEAALKSGSLITARLASEQGREVFAIPGSIHAPQSRGCHALLRQGAKLVETASDVLEELQGVKQQPPAPSGTPTPISVSETQDPLLAALGHDPQSLDSLIERTGLGAAELQARLLDLELEGEVARMPGGRFQRLARG